MSNAPTEADIALAQVAAGGAAQDFESPTLDFKEDRQSRGDTERLIADACICFANSAGGTIVVGVNDKIRGSEAIIGTKLDPNRI